MLPPIRLSQRMDVPRSDLSSFVQILEGPLTDLTDESPHWSGSAEAVIEEARETGGGDRETEKAAHQQPPICLRIRSRMTMMMMVPQPQPESRTTTGLCSLTASP